MLNGWVDRLELKWHQKLSWRCVWNYYFLKVLLKSIQCFTRYFANRLNEQTSAVYANVLSEENAQRLAIWVYNVKGSQLLLH